LRGASRSSLATNHLDGGRREPAEPGPCAFIARNHARPRKYKIPCGDLCILFWFLIGRLQTPRGSGCILRASYDSLVSPSPSSQGSAGHVPGRARAPLSRLDTT